MYHAYKKLTPTTIRSGEEIAQAIGGDLSKAGIKRDLYDTVLKVLTGLVLEDKILFKDLDLNLVDIQKNLVMQKLHLLRILIMLENYKQI